MMQWSKPTLADLRRERRAATFDVYDLTKAIYSEEELSFIEKHVKICMQEPRLQTDDLWYITRTERYTRACERAALYVKMIRENNIPWEERTWLAVMLGEDLFLLLHNVMFTPTLMNQADEEQQSWWLAKAMNYEIFGTYAQTEITHGSNVRGLKTTATFDESLYGGDGGWIVQSPSLEAAKWWPGGLAKSCNCVILMARVIIKGKDYGPHPFFFQVRDWETHESLPGIELRDIGQKIGYNGMDNGFMRITNVKIPRRNLLMRFVHVDKDGTYKKIGDQKMLFSTMTYTRLMISMTSGFKLATACTTAIRYSAVRRQFQMQRTSFGSDMEGPDMPNSEVKSQLDHLIRPSKRTETQVLDYLSQQYLLFPQIALAYALQWSAYGAKKLYNEKIVDFRAGKFTFLAEMHVLTATLKAVNTVLAADGMEQCRKCCGGHGFLNAAGIGPQIGSALPMATYEGDFVVLSIQVGQQLLNAVSAKMLKGKTSNPGTPLLQYIYDFDPAASQKPPSRDELKELLKDPLWLKDALTRRANYLNYSCAQTIQEVIAETGKMDASALDKVKIELTEMTWSHGYVMQSIFFWNRLKEIEQSFPHLHPALSRLFQLFCLTIMGPSYDRGGGFGDFVAAGVCPGSAKPLILKRTKELLEELRPLAVTLVDAWNIPDFVVNSCLGRYDGRYMEALYEQTNYEPLNKTDVSEGYYKHLQYVLHPERARGATAKL
jgi:acyl-CoA oxidase